MRQEALLSGIDNTNNLQVLGTHATKVVSLVEEHTPKKLFSNFQIWLLNSIINPQNLKCDVIMGPFLISNFKK